MEPETKSDSTSSRHGTLPKVIQLVLGVLHTYFDKAKCEMEMVDISE